MKAFFLIHVLYTAHTDGYLDHVTRAALPFCGIFSIFNLFV